MEIKKTTMLSLIVGITGILAEIIFHDTLTTSVLGVALSILLAVVIIVSVYFLFDGICYMISQMHDQTKMYCEKSDKKIIKQLEEQLAYEKTIYNELTQLAEMTTLLNTIKNEVKKSSPVIVEEKPVQQPVIEEKGPVEISEEVIQKLIEDINGNTIKAAKIIAKYINKNTVELKEEIKKTQDEIHHLPEKIAVSQKSMEVMQRKETPGSEKKTPSAIDLFQLEETPIESKAEELLDPKQKKY